MKDLTNSKNNNNTSEEIQAIKDDIKDLAKRLGNLKDGASDVLLKEAEQLMNALSGIKDKAVKGSQSGVENVAAYVSKSPLQCIAYTLGLGIMLGALLKK